MVKGKAGIVQFLVGFLTGIFLSPLILCSAQGGERETRVVGSANENIGILNVNQASGHVNNQSNVRVFSIGLGPAQLNEIRMERSTSASPIEIDSSEAMTKQDLIETSFQNNLGVMGINQSAGTSNTQSNVLLLTVGSASTTNIQGATPVAEEDLDRVSASNILREERGTRRDVIRNSFSNSSGIAQVTQSAGDLNIQTNAIVFSFRETYLK